MTEEDFVRAAHVIHTFGEPQKFYKKTRIYLVHNGWKYWTMSEDHNAVRLINRGPVGHVYGVQNMPSTRSTFQTVYNEIGTHWDHHYSLNQEERRAFSSVFHELSGGYKKFRTLDIGSGTGMSLDLSLAEAIRLTAVDPSQAMLNELVRKHPHVARVEAKTLSKAIHERVFAGTRFDMVLALGGSAAYLTADDWSRLISLGTGRFLISTYKDDVLSHPSDFSTSAIQVARTRLTSTQKAHGGSITEVGRFLVWSHNSRVS